MIYVNKVAKGRNHRVLECCKIFKVTANALTETSFECKSEGRFADPSDCGYYFECIPIEIGSLNAYRRSCNGEAFDPETNSCTRPSKVKGCKIRESRHYLPSTRYNELCSDASIKYACADCGTLVMCSEGKGYDSKCEDDFLCTTGLANFDGGICYPQYDEKCSCREGNTYYQDLYYNGTFFFCKENGSTPSFFHCPPDMYFDEDVKSCKNEDGLPLCTEWGIFAYPDDCTKYYTCTYAVEGWIQSRLECSAGLLLNVETGNCENPCDWPTNKFKCDNEGRFKNPKDCNQYIECIKSMVEGEFLTMLRKCPRDWHWNDKNKSCVKSENLECKPSSEGPIKYCEKDYDFMCGSNKTNSSNENGYRTITTFEQVEPLDT